MQRLPVLLFITIFFSLYGLLNFYIGLRGRQGLSNLPFFIPKFYWTVIWLLALAYLVGRIGEKYLPPALGTGLSYIGAYWIVALVYFFIFAVVVDLLRLLNHLTNLFPAWRGNSLVLPVLTLLIITTVAGILFYGTWNARHPVVNRYEVEIIKPGGPLRELRVAMLADLHLGAIMNNARLQQAVQKVNELEPDIVLMPGDVIDEDIDPATWQRMSATFRSIRAKYGVWAAPGNHEYISGSGAKLDRIFREAGIKLLRDDAALVAGSFYLVGRDDRSAARYLGHSRRTLNQILEKVDRKKPMIVLDHQPSGLNEPRQAGVDLQFSGHTHRGQFFPIGLFTQRIFENDWGYLRQGNFHLIVTSGFGTWGPPVRIASQSEVVDLIIKFTQKEGG